MDYGDLVTFSYSAVHKAKSAAHDPYPTVLVLHPNYEGKMHGIKWDMLSATEQEILKMILSEAYEAQNKNFLARRDPASAKLFDSLTQSSMSHDIRTPSQFYTNVIKPFIIRKAVQVTPYRQYRLDRVTNVRTKTPSTLMTAKLSGGQPPPAAPPGAQPGPAPQAKQGVVQKLKDWGKKKGLWESYVEKSRGTRGPLMANRAPNFRRNK